MKSFYITTTLPYVNAEPHIGFALEIVTADVIARYHRLIGDKVVFNTGTDEHGQKIYQKALDQSKTPKEYVDEYAQKFARLKKALNLSYTHFIRTTDKHHQKAAQEFWRRCATNGDIYKARYKTKYCVGCELEKTDSELVDGRCPLHPDKELEIREEENYFFRFSKYQDKLLKLYQGNPEFVKPEKKLKEIKTFVEGGLKDFSISRLNSKMPWGVPVPNDNKHVMYVWFDALVNYVSTLGWPEDKETFEKFWGTKEKPKAVQIAGKDNLRQQAAMWQAMLMSANLPTSKQILINGFISVGGQKMSKSLGNVISPFEMVGRYGVDATRFLLLNLGPIGDDMDVSWERLDREYTAYLANGLGNLASRVAKLASQTKAALQADISTFKPKISQALDRFDVKTALNEVKHQVEAGDKYLSETKPWLLESEERIKAIKPIINQVTQIAYQLQPFMPEIAKKLLDHFGQKKIEPLKPLFPRVKER